MNPIADEVKRLHDCINELTRSHMFRDLIPLETHVHQIAEVIRDFLGRHL